MHVCYYWLASQPHACAMPMHTQFPLADHAGEKGHLMLVIATISAACQGALLTSGQVIVPAMGPLPAP